MSKSYNLKVSFNFRAVVSDEDIQKVLRDMELYQRSLGAEKYHMAEALVKAYEAEGIDGLLATVFKDQVKQMRSAIMEMAEGSDYSHFSPFQVEIKPRG